MNRVIRIGLTLACAGCIQTGSAGVLYDNGPVTTSTNWCDTQGSSACGAAWTIADDFTLAMNAVVGGFTYNDYVLVGAVSDYAGTVWNIWNGDPLVAGSSIVASGTGAGAVVAGNQGSVLVTVTGLNVPLTAGTYWLGIQTQEANDGTWGRGQASATGNAEQWNGPADRSASSYSHSLGLETPFTILDSDVNVPEPSTLALFGAGVALLAIGRRLKRA